MAIQVQLQALMAVGETEEVVSRPNIESNTEVAKLQVFDGAVKKVLGFIMTCRLFIRMKMRENMVEEQI